MTLRCWLLGHKFVRHPDREDSCLHPDWGYLRCARLECRRSGYLRLSNPHSANAEPGGGG